MKIQTIKQIAVSFLAGAALQGSAFAESPTGTHRLAAVPALAARKTARCPGHATTLIHRRSTGGPATSVQVTPGEDSFSVGNDWFRD